MVISTTRDWTWADARTNMDNNIIRCSLVLSLAVVGCSRLTIVGVSDDSVPLTAATAALTATEISAKTGEMLQTYDPPLGDIDGDGLDDLILFGYQIEGARVPGAIPAYLFYGRASFPAQLSAADADATFETGNWNTNLAVGDVNGDGLGDFAASWTPNKQTSRLLPTPIQLRSATSMATAPLI